MLSGFSQKKKNVSGNMVTYYRGVKDIFRLLLTTLTSFKKPVMNFFWAQIMTDVISIN